MIIKRDLYLDKLIERKKNGAIKVITGLRRSGKSFLLFNLYYQHLLSVGVPEDRIIRIALDDEVNEHLWDRQELGSYVRQHITDEGDWYVFLDEVQLVAQFEKVLNGLNRMPNLDIYVTGSNSKFLSTDILTEFRGRGDEIRVFPLSFSEYSSAFTGSVQEAWKEYFTYGGLPQILTRKSDESKSQYLKTLMATTYLADVMERNGVEDEVMMEALLDVLASSIGSLTNPYRIANTFKSKGSGSTSDITVRRYIGHLMDAFLIDKAARYDVKGRRHIGSPYKYYFTDVGLRNARLNFRQQEENHIMENILYNELLIRGYNVDVGVVEVVGKDATGKSVRKQHEIDFICNKASQRLYIQSAFSMHSEEKRKQEEASLRRIDDSFTKMIIVKDDIKPWRSEAGILTVGLTDFLLHPESALF